MTEQYTQTVDINIKSTSRKMQIVGLSFKLLSFGFVLVAGLVNWYFLFAFVGFFAIGIVFTQFYNNAPKQFEYNFNQHRLVVSKMTMLGRKQRFLEILFEDVINIELFNDLAKNDDISACENIQESGVYCITFLLNDKEARLLISPDEYMTQLLLDKVNNQN